ncbi:MAG: hypothetical protein IT289_01545 [Oligoflexia bacterium]|nr:hypothetical protein [Oligoflexia bacterium]
MRSAILGIIVFVSGHGVWAEYRVYQLGIKQKPQDKAERMVLTTLDHLQYPDYFKIYPKESVRLVDHWMCRGRTDEMTPLCKKPKAPAADLPKSSELRSPASN